MHIFSTTVQHCSHLLCVVQCTVFLLNEVNSHHYHFAQATTISRQWKLNEETNATKETTALLYNTATSAEYDCSTTCTLVSCGSNGQVDWSVVAAAAQSSCWFEWVWWSTAASVPVSHTVQINWVYPPRSSNCLHRRRANYKQALSVSQCWLCSLCSIHIVNVDDGELYSFTPLLQSGAVFTPWHHRQTGDYFSKERGSIFIFKAINQVQSALKLKVKDCWAKAVGNTVAVGSTRNIASKWNKSGQ